MGYFIVKLIDWVDRWDRRRRARAAAEQQSARLRDAIRVTSRDVTVSRRPRR